MPRMELWKRSVRLGRCCVELHYGTVLGTLSIGCCQVTQEIGLKHSQSSPKNAYVGARLAIVMWCGYCSVSFQSVFQDSLIIHKEKTKEISV